MGAYTYLPNRPRYNVSAWMDLEDLTFVLRQMLCTDSFQGADCDISQIIDQCVGHVRFVDSPYTHSVRKDARKLTRCTIWCTHSDV